LWNIPKIKKINLYLLYNRIDSSPVPDVISEREGGEKYFFGNERACRRFDAASPLFVWRSNHESRKGAEKRLKKEKAEKRIDGKRFAA
jgi:hypothetical protein